MDIQELFDAVNSLNAEDAFKPRLSPEQWRLFQPFLSRHEIRAGDLVVRDVDEAVDVGVGVQVERDIVAS